MYYRVQSVHVESSIQSGLLLPLLRLIRGARTSPPLPITLIVLIGSHPPPVLYAVHSILFLFHLSISIIAAERRQPDRALVDEVTRDERSGVQQNYLAIKFKSSI